MIILIKYNWNFVVLKCVIFFLKEFLGTLFKLDFYFLKENLKFSKDEFFIIYIYYYMKNIKDITLFL